MNLWLKVKQDIAKELGVGENEIQEPDKFGDFAFPMFKKKLDVSKIGKIGLVKKMEQTGPYVNFYVDWAELGGRLLKEIDKNYGRSYAKEKVSMDIYQANPFKAFHIGHVRNAVLGESIRRILEFTGRKTIAVSFSGDVGIHVARWLLYFQKHYKGGVPKENFTKWAGEIYAASAETAKQDKEFEKKAQELNRKIDKRSRSIASTWKRLRDRCYKDYDKIRKELNGSSANRVAIQLSYIQ